MQCLVNLQAQPVNQPALTIGPLTAASSFIWGCSVHDSTARGVDIQTPASFSAASNLILNAVGHALAVRVPVSSPASLLPDAPLASLAGNVAIGAGFTSSGLLSELTPAGMYVSAPYVDIRYGRMMPR